ncbi:Ribonucleoside-diphosphate reductase subunit alpha [compost metagenome]
MQINKYLVADLKALGMWNEDLRNEIKMHDGSIDEVVSIPPQIKELYRTVWEIPMKSLVDMAADRGAYIDQAQSLNLFMESPTIGKLSSMYMYAWKKGVKTTYYLRSRPATKIAKATVTTSRNSAGMTSSSSNSMDAQGTSIPATAVEVAPVKKAYSDSEVIACSLDNPEACEACQ